MSEKVTRRARQVLVWAALVAASVCGCSGSERTIDLVAAPSHASMFGQVDVQLNGDFSPLGTVQSVSINGIQALDVVATPEQVIVHLQGSPSPGPVEVHRRSLSRQNAAFFPTRSRSAVGRAALSSSRVFASRASR